MFFATFLWFNTSLFLYNISSIDCFSLHFSLSNIFWLIYEAIYLNIFIFKPIHSIFPQLFNPMTPLFSCYLYRLFFSLFLLQSYFLANLCCSVGKLIDLEATNGYRPLAVYGHQWGLHRGKGLLTKKIL